MSDGTLRLAIPTEMVAQLPFWPKGPKGPKGHKGPIENVSKGLVQWLHDQLLPKTPKSFVPNPVRRFLNAHLNCFLQKERGFLSLDSKGPGNGTNPGQTLGKYSPPMPLSN